MVSEFWQFISRILLLSRSVGEWSFFTNHARVLICIAGDPGLRLRDLAAVLGITERSAYGIVADLVQAGYVVKDKDGRRNRYRVEGHLPLPEPIGRERTIGDILVLLVEADARRPPRRQTKERHAT
jgi:MarR family